MGFIVETLVLLLKLAMFRIQIYHVLKIFRNKIVSGKTVRNKVILISNCQENFQERVPVTFIPTFRFSNLVYKSLSKFLFIWPLIVTVYDVSVRHDS